MQRRNDEATPQGAPSWFQGAPTCKLVALSTASAFMVLRSRNMFSSLMFDTSLLAQQPSRYWLSKLIFSTPNVGEFLMGSSLYFYWIRSIERQMGSRKFVSFFFAINVISIGIEFLLYKAYFWNTAMPAWVYGGPYPLLGALACFFHLHTPRLHPRFVQGFGFSFSEKTIGYGWFAFVAFSQRRNTLMACGEGVLAWVLYRAVLEKKAIIPNVSAVRSMSTWFAGMLEDPQGLVAIGAQRRRGGPAVPRHPPEQRQPVPRQQPAAVEPDPDAVQQLMSMGFGQREAERALVESNNVIERAADRLLNM